jgi:DNA polymerase I-like protein with 3'-5' exonuclease and polymerase domains
VTYLQGDFYQQNGEFFTVLEIVDELKSYKIRQCNEFGFTISETEILVPIKCKGRKKFKPKKYVPTLQEIRDSYVPDENIEPLEDYILLNEHVTKDILDVFRSSPEIGFDIETYGVQSRDHALDARKGEIRLLQVYLPIIDKVIVWDLHKQDSLGFLNVLKNRLASDNCKVYIHNASFETRWVLEKFDTHIVNIYDSMILSQNFYAGLSRGFNACGISSPHSLKEVCIRELGVDLDKENQVFDYYLPLTNNQYNYAAKDAKYTYLAGKVLYDKCVKDGLYKVIKADLSAIPAFNLMNSTGLPIDLKRVDTLLQQYSNAVDKVSVIWQEIAPDLNLNSPKQLLAFFEQFKINNTNDENKKSTDNATLTRVTLELEKRSISVPKEKYVHALFMGDERERNHVLCELMKSLLLRRSLLIDINFLTKWREMSQDGILYSTYVQNADNCTGRSSCKNPNTQNIPKLTGKKSDLGCESLRTCFKPKQGDAMIIVDFNGSHTQIFRQACQDPKLVESKKSGIKEHFYTTAGLLKMQNIEMIPQEIAKVYKDKEHEKHPLVKQLYAAAKTVFFGSLNLNGAATLQASFLDKADQLVDLDICKEYINGWRSYYAVGYAFQKTCIARGNTDTLTFELNTSLGRQKIGVSGAKIYAKATSLDGGRLFVEKFPSKYSGRWEGKGTDIVSYTWLRCEGTIIKNAMGQLFKVFQQNKHWKARFWQMTHDELGVLCDEKYKIEVASIVNETMAECFIEFVPDYEPDSYDPESCIVSSWEDK